MRHTGQTAETPHHLHFRSAIWRAVVYAVWSVGAVRGCQKEARMQLRACRGVHAQPGWHTPSPTSLRTTPLNSGPSRRVCARKSGAMADAQMRPCNAAACAHWAP